MREEFEKLPEIKERIKRSEAFYCQKGDWYLSPHEGCREDEAFLDGAWYAYQEQQKIINMQECGAKKILEIISDDGLMYEAMIERIKELLG